ncbi:ectoine synthase [Exilibacterium tricleocarpae]|uniref:L-ectoine synthase n=1 Tax=Exilibacterium tricleocarpae TaxID=2591008 RepID=A0A545TYY0_9GAMM|nr:ectoine synthase [Exilibacterium tricleocarpae]TQV82393.1 ectoine synthase [Exilibacterium tricleocarpae]
MIIRTVKGLESDSVVSNEWFTSYRILLAKDNMGFSLHLTKTKAGSRNIMQYKNHLEAVYCISGQGRLMDLDNNRSHLISPGTLYALDENDKHILEAKTNLELLCIFNPPCIGSETHDESGSYPLLEV